jgi:hypothetical protein
MNRTPTQPSKNMSRYVYTPILLFWVFVFTTIAVLAVSGR